MRAIDIEQQFGIPNTSVVIEFRCVRKRPTVHKHEIELTDEIKEYCLKEALIMLSSNVCEFG